MKNYKNNFFIIGVVSTVFVIALIFTSRVYAGFGSSGGRYFGGKVEAKIECTCNPEGGSQITLSGPFGSSGTYLETTETRIIGNGEISMMSRLLGKATEGGVCMVGVEPYCTELPITKGMIDYTGLASGF